MRCVFFFKRVKQRLRKRAAIRFKQIGIRLPGETEGKLPRDERRKTGEGGKQPVIQPLRVIDLLQKSAEGLAIRLRGNITILPRR